MNRNRSPSRPGENRTRPEPCRNPNGPVPPAESVHTANGKQGNFHCTAVIGSMTQALLARECLSQAAIRSSLIKISSSETAGGCAYGLDFPCVQFRHVQVILSRCDIRVRRYLNGD